METQDEFKVGEIPIQQSESIKLSKMSKGYNWESKVISKEEMMTVETAKRAKEINDWLEENYGNQES